MTNKDIICQTSDKRSDKEKFQILFGVKLKEFWNKYPRYDNVHRPMGFDLVAFCEWLKVVMVNEYQLDSVFNVIHDRYGKEAVNLIKQLIKNNHLNEARQRGKSEAERGYPCRIIWQRGSDMQEAYVEGWKAQRNQMTPEEWDRRHEKE